MNERQRALLERLAAGEEPAHWRPGDPVTEAGCFYLGHGRHPDDPAF
ncbi:hypothetical protein AB0D40_37010 [Streptomyces massasporeus]